MRSQGTLESRLEEGIQCLPGFLSPRIHVPGALSPVRSLAVQEGPRAGEMGGMALGEEPSCPCPSHQVFLGARVVSEQLVRTVPRALELP